MDMVDRVVAAEGLPRDAMEGAEASAVHFEEQLEDTKVTLMVEEAKATVVAEVATEDVDPKEELAMDTGVKVCMAKWQVEAEVLAVT